MSEKGFEENVSHQAKKITRLNCIETSLNNPYFTFPLSLIYPISFELSPCKNDWTSG